MTQKGFKHGPEDIALRELFDNPRYIDWIAKDARRKGGA